MFLLTAGKYISLTWRITKLSVLSAMEYRVSFILQVVGMLVNQIGFILVWFIFFQKFPSVNGWGFSDTILLYAVSSIGSSLCALFTNGIYNLPTAIARGQLDYFLTLPKNTLWQVATGKVSIAAIGELLFGIMIFLLFGQASWSKGILLIILSIIIAVIIFNFMTIVGSVAFFAGNFEEAADQLEHSLTAFTLYPQSIFHGGLKVIMMTILPAFFIATLPVQLLRSFDIWWFLALLVFAILTFIIGSFIYNQGLKRYESGNLININK